jgi:hypothetical protein
MLNTIELSKSVFICVLGVTLSVVLFGPNRGSAGRDRSHFGHRDR